MQDFEAQFNVRVNFHKEHQEINTLEYYEDISKNYIEHSLFMLLNNIENSTTNNIKEEIIKIRKSYIYSYCFKYYKSSKKGTLKMKLLIILFKYKLYSLLILAYKL